jgi:hypothetical protein
VATAGNAVAKTRAQIQFKVLAILTGGDVGTNPSAEDAAAIDGYIDCVVAELAGDTVVIEDPNTLGDDIFVNFCKLVANAAAEEFGAKSDAKAAQAWHNNIRAIRRPMPGYGPQETTDY